MQVQDMPCGWHQRAAAAGRRWRWRWSQRQVSTACAALGKCRRSQIGMRGGVSACAQCSFARARMRFSLSPLSLVCSCSDRMVLSVRRRIHCGIGRFWRCFFARIFFTLKVLLDGCRRAKRR